jgi:membrane protease YdiL (CAAX protease family)
MHPHIYAATVNYAMIPTGTPEAPLVTPPTEAHSLKAARTLVVLAVALGIPALYPLLASVLNLIPRAWMSTVPAAIPQYFWLHALSFIVVVVVLIIVLGRLRPRDVGLVARHIIPGLLVMIGVWLVMQAALAAIAAWGGMGVQIHAGWGSASEKLVGALLANLIGTALFEEVVYRGFLFPQVFMRLRTRWPRGRRRTLAAAMLISSFCFALAHLPTFLFQSRPLPQVAAVMVMLMLAGVYGSVLYLRTGNLMVGLGIHALYNAPTALVESDNSTASMIVLGLGALVALAWPQMQKAGAGRSILPWHAMTTGPSRTPEPLVAPNP